METEEKKQEIIIFSNLSKQEKIKYFNFFLDNDIQFDKEPKGTYIAEIQILDKAPKGSDSEKKSEKGNKSSSKYQKRELDQTYPIIFNIINPQTGTKGSKLNLNVLRYYIEEFYSTRFLEDTKAMANQDADIIPFPEFFANFLISRYNKKKNVVDQLTLNILSSVEFYSRTYKDIKIFSKFLTEEYDSDDLIFYLFVRSCIEKELKFLFLDKARQATNSNHENPEANEIYVTRKNSENIGLKIFGKNEEEMLNNFNKKISMLYDKESMNNKHELIKASSILAFSLDDYHAKNNEEVNEGDEEEEEEKQPVISSFNGLDENTAEKYEQKNDFEKDEDNDELLVETTKAPIEETKPNNSNSKSGKTSKNTKNSKNVKIAVESNKATESNLPKAEKSETFISICKKYKIDKCKSESERSLCLKNIINEYIAQRELNNYFKRLISSTKIFTENEAKINKNLSKVKNFASQRFNLLISMVFQKDKKKFLTLLSLKENSPQGGKYYSTLISIKDSMMKTKPFSNLDESAVIKFIKAISDIPENVSQISKMIFKIINPSLV